MTGQIRLTCVPPNIENFNNTAVGIDNSLADSPERTSLLLLNENLR